ncbi:DUF2207 family protein [Streptomyces sp. NPDC016566]|uniref:DUF2207 family protein n=1 Tax=Streptomyces sp. NPDC016566 TaxID=3364967 RepID=UPI0036FAB36B
MVSSLVVLTLCPVLFGALVYAVRRREAMAPVPVPPPPQELAAALVNLLLGKGEVTPKAIETTGLELVHAGRLRLERKADGTRTVRLADEADSRRPLRAFEELLLERVRHRCRVHVDRVPMEALGPGDGDEYWVWWRGFQRSVQEEALALGLIRPTREKYLTWTLRIAGVLAWVGILFACSGFGPVVFDAVFKATVVPSVVPLLWFQWFPRRPRSRLTAAGRQASAWWRTGPHAAAHRLPDRQVGAKGPASALPVRAPRRIWSSYEKSWHVVDTAPLDRPRWGHVWQLVLLAIALCAATVAPALTPRIPHGVTLDAGPALVGAVVAALWLPAHRRIRRVPAEVAFRGAVISRWDYTTRHDDPPTITVHYCCSIEDPGSHRAWSFKVDEWRHPMFSNDSNPELENRFRVGDVVDLHCSPRRRKIYSITMVEAVPR